MGFDSPQALTIAVDAAGTAVSALLDSPPDARALYVFAHGAGAGMTHRSWRRSPTAWPSAASRRCATSSRTWSAARSGPTRRRSRTPRCARRLPMRAMRLPGLPLFAGGKSFGGRMTSQAQAAAPLPGVRGLVFLGFPLHPAGKPSDERAEHLSDVDVPDAVPAGHARRTGRFALLRPVVDGSASAHARLFDEADHSFHVPAAAAVRMRMCGGECWTRPRAGSNGSSLLAPETGALAPSAATA